MTSKLISSQTVISKVISDLDLSEDGLRISDMLEWIGEAIHKIGGLSDMNYQVDVLKLNHNQAKLPCDMNKLIQVAYSHTPEGPWRATRYNTGSFKMSVNDTRIDGNPTDDGDFHRYVSDNVMVEVYRTMYKRENLSFAEALAELNGNEELRIVLRRLINSKDWKTFNSTDFSTDIQYYIKPGYIVCNIPDGYVKIAYNGIHRDEYGYAMIPDQESYIEAIYWYIVMKLQYPQYVSGKIPQHVYYEAKNNWKSYCRQAYGDIKMPNLDQLESIKNTWNRIYPVMDEHETFYSTVGQEELIYNRNGRYPRYARGSGYGKII